MEFGSKGSTRNQRSGAKCCLSQRLKVGLGEAKEDIDWLERRLRRKFDEPPVSILKNNEACTHFRDSHSR